MYKFSANKILLAASALLMCAGFAQAQTSPLTAAPTSVSISYSLQSSTAGAAVPVTLTIASGAGDAFVVDPSTVPFWLSLSAMNGTAVPAKPGPAVTVSFNASSGAAALLAGVYSASVHVQVVGFSDLVVPVSLAVSAAPSTLSVTNAGTPVATGGSIPLSYTYGSTTYPTATLTLISSNDPISYTVTSAVTTPAHTVDYIQVSAASGIAYSYGTGTQFTISFLPGVFKTTTVGQVLNGSVTIGYGTSQTYVVNLAITVAEPLPTVTSIFPQETPKQGAGSATIVVTGSGFGTTLSGYTTPTQVSIAYGSVAATDLTTITSTTGVHGAVKVVNPNTMILTIPWNDSTPVSILNTVQPITITVTNNLTGETLPVTAPVLNVASTPIIYSITDAAALEEPAPGATATVAPYEMVSIFGNNFCPTCSSPVVSTLTSNRYPTSITAGGHPLTVTFFKADGTTLVGDAYILFANNTQINALVPSTVTAADNPMQVVVSYNSTVSNGNVVYSANAVTNNPGIFTMSSSGQGQGAILLSPSYAVNSTTNPAPTGSTVLIYLSGMGAPTSTAGDVSGVTAAIHYPTSCVSASSYVTVASLTSPSTADGAVLQAGDINANLLPPCFATAPAVTIGGNTAVVTYAGWVADSVAGLYQINVTVPTKATKGTNSVVVTMGTGVNAVSSQAGVTMQVN